MERKGGPAKVACQRPAARRPQAAGDNRDELANGALVKRSRVVKSQAADLEIDDFMTVPRSRPRPG